MLFRKTAHEFTYNFERLRNPSVNPEITNGESLARMDIPDKDLLIAEEITKGQNECGNTYGYCRVAAQQ